MNFNFEKSEMLIEFLTACDIVLSVEKEDSEVLKKAEILSLHLMLTDGKYNDSATNIEFIEELRKKNIPSIKDIEKEFYSNCTKVEDVPFVFRMFSSLWIAKLLPPSLFSIYYKDEFLSYIGAKTIIIKGEIEKLFESLSKAAKEYVPNIYREDDIAIIMKSLSLSLSDKTNVNFDSSITDMVYNQCNGNLWVNIEKEDFISMLGTGELNVQIKTGNNQRVYALFNRLGILTSSNATWVRNVEQSLGIDRLSKILKLDSTNSSRNKEFNHFLDEIYSL